MGGFGSGRRNQGGKAITNDFQALDIRHLQRKNLLRPGLIFSLDWARNRKASTTVVVQTDTEKMVLNYRHQRADGEWLDMEYQIWLEWNPCNYGGLRVWLRCPTSECGRRVAKLYLGRSGRFTCRHCNQLAYSSQRETVSGRALRLTRSIRGKLGWDLSLLDHNVAKPKGIHWKTYRLLRAQHDALATEYLDSVAKRLGVLNRQLGGIRDDLNRED